MSSNSSQHRETTARTEEQRQTSRKTGETKVTTKERVGPLVAKKERRKKVAFFSLVPACVHPSVCQSLSVCVSFCLDSKRHPHTISAGSLVSQFSVPQLRPRIVFQIRFMVGSRILLLRCTPDGCIP